MGIAGCNRLLGGLLVIAKLWQHTMETAKTAKPPTRRQRAWNAAVFVAWLSVVMLAISWWQTGGNWPRWSTAPAGDGKRTLAGDEPAEANKPDEAPQLARP